MQPNDTRSGYWGKSLGTAHVDLEVNLIRLLNTVWVSNGVYMHVFTERIYCAN